MSRTDQRTELSDGRELCYDEYVSRDGKPLLYFHGTPGSRKEWLLFGSEALAERHGLRVVCVDRPGMGAVRLPARPKPYRTARRASTQTRVTYL